MMLRVEMMDSVCHLLLDTLWVDDEAATILEAGFV